MREPVEFFAPGEPKGQPRARACIRGKRAGVYDPGTADAWKHAVADAWRSQVAREDAPHVAPFETAVQLKLTFYLRRPKGHYRANGEVKPSAPRHHTGKPDIDNLAKAVMDVLTRLGAWTDDALVCNLHVVRRWADGTLPGCRVAIAEEDG